MLNNQVPEMVPSIDEWTREEFLAARAAQHSCPGLNHIEELLMSAGQPYEVHTINPGNLIVCDGCNCKIETPTILLVEFGRKVNCAACFLEYHANEPVVWRRLRPDGSIGDVVSKPSL